MFYVYVVKRPGIEEFLERMYKLYEIVIYTASLSIYADPLLDEIDPLNYASFRLFREHCTFYNNAFVKDLSQLGRDLKDVIIVDNSPASYLFQPENAIPILTWIDDMQDTKLYELSPVLEFIANVGDVRNAIKDIVENDSSDFIKAVEILREKYLPKPKLQTLMSAWSEAQIDTKGSSEAKRETQRKSPLKVVNPQQAKVNTGKIVAIDKAYLSMSPMTPQYKKINGALQIAGLAKIPQQETSKKVLVKKIIGNSNPENNSPTRKAVTQKPGLESTVTEDSPGKKRPITEHSEKRKKASTPTPYSIPTLGKGISGKSLKGKAIPLHQQPRQNSSTMGKGIRAATPNSLTTQRHDFTDTVGHSMGSKALQQQQQLLLQNSKGGKTQLFYTNLLKMKGGETNREHTKGDNSTYKENCATATSPKGKPNILGGNSILKGLEESANKKLNKHSSSLDNTDWMACYEKIRKDVNLNSPKDVPVSGRVSVNGTRPNGVVLLADYLPKRQLVTPTPQNPFSGSKASKKVQVQPKPMTKEKSKPVLVAKNEKFTNMMVQIGGKQAVLDKGVKRPVVFSIRKGN